MLVLSRKKDQTIRIGEKIVIRVCEVRGNCVRIGIEAPNDVLVLRGELDEWNSLIPEIPEQTLQTTDIVR